MIDIWTTTKKVIEKKTRYNPYDVYSNCVTNIPQYIDLTLENNVLTAKAGTKAPYPNGTIYTEVELNNDVTLNIGTTNGKFFVCLAYSGNSMFARNINSCVSGSGATAVGGFAFDTDEISITNYSASGQAGGRYTAPLCMIEVENGVASFAKNSEGQDLIFNGISYIGHHAIIYPEINGLWANGYEDGILNSVERTTNEMMIIELLGGSYNTLSLYGNNNVKRRINIGEFETFEDLPLTASDDSLAYIKSGNYFAHYLNNQWNAIYDKYLNIVNYNYDGLTVLDFIIRQPYEDAAEQTLYEPEEYEVEFNRTFLNVGETAVFKAKNILETQENSLAYEPNMGIDLKRFLDPDVKIQNKTFEAYSIQKLSEQGINTIELLSNKQTFNEIFDYTVAETDNEGMIAQ